MVPRTFDINSFIGGIRLVINMTFSTPYKIKIIFPDFLGIHGYA